MLHVLTALIFALTGFAQGFMGAQSANTYVDQVQVVSGVISGDTSSATGEVYTFIDPTVEATIQNMTGKSTITDTDLAEIYFLEIGDAESINVDDLLHFPNLAYVSIYSAAIENPDVLDDLHALSLLAFSVDADQLDALPQLEKHETLMLTIEGLEDPEAVVRFAANLESLSLSEPQFTDYSALEALENLTYLGIYDPTITSLPDLSMLPLLQYLDLSCEALEDIEAAAGIRSLYSINIMYGNVTDLSPLSGQEELYTVAVEETPLSDLTPLAANKNLQELWLDNNKIVDLSPLAGLEKLYFLSVDNNEITDASPVLELPALEYLYINDNPIEDMSILEDFGY